MYTPNPDKLFTSVRFYIKGAKMEEAIRALTFARQKHDGQTRKDGTPYIVHPLAMANYAIAIGLRDDNILATILLHDVVEDCGEDVNRLPFNSVVRDGVRHMTITKFSTDVDKIETKCRYFRELLNSREAVICKALDRYNNLSDAPMAMSADSVGKNVAETEVLLLPVLKEAQSRYDDLSDAIYVLRENLRVLLNILSNQFPEEYSMWKKIYERRQLDPENGGGAHD